jgi:hypothetical protein
MDSCERVELDMVALQRLDSSHHAIEAGPPTLIDPVGIMQLTRAINGDPNQEVSFCKKAPPNVVEQDSIGLKRVVNALAICVLGLECDDLLKVLNYQQRGLAALPAEENLIRLLLLNVLPNVGCIAECRMYCRM